jgi:hypothetical protein
MHTIATRPPSPTEQRLIAGLTKPNVASWGCLAIIFGIVPALLLGALGGWLGGFISDEASTYGQWIGWILSAILLVSVVFSFFPFERRMRRRAARDQQDRIVQEIHVVEPRVIEIGLINDNEPILAFDVGSNKILFLQGQWLRDAGTYGTDGPEDDSGDEFINGLPAPHSFPSTEFTVSRFPHSGEVLGIRVHGKYAPPQSVVEALRFEYEFGDSELFDGSLEEIASLLAREHEQRKALIANG